MDNIISTKALKVAMQKRILNEFGAKILNEERLDKIMKSRLENRIAGHAMMLFYCECDAESCGETISLSTEEYEKVHSKTRYFIVVPNHVRLDLEEVISSFSNYAQVGKFFPRAARS